MYTTLYVRQAVVVYKGKEMKNLLVLMMLAVSLNAVASEEGAGGWSGTNTNTNNNSNSNNNSSSASSGSNTQSVGYNNNYQRNPVASAIAPNVYNSVICPIINQSSHAAQTIIFGGSTTGIPTVNAICVAYNLNQAEVVERMTCASDSAYKKANPNCK
jgi:hypothetical protein